MGRWKFLLALFALSSGCSTDKLLAEGTSLSILAADAGDTFETATNIPLGHYVIDSLETVSDVDYFKFTLTSGQPHTLTLFKSFFVFDDQLQSEFIFGVRDQNDSSISVSSTRPSGTLRQITFTPTYTGPHIFRLASDDGFGEYAFGAVLGGSAVFPNASLPLASTVELPDAVLSGGLTFAPQTEALRFSYVPSATGTLHLAGFHSFGELEYSVYDGNGALLTDNAEGTENVIRVPVVQGEEIYIHIASPTTELLLVGTTEQTSEEDNNIDNTAYVSAVSVLSCLLAFSTVANVSMLRKARPNKIV